MVSEKLEVVTAIDAGGLSVLKSHLHWIILGFLEFAVPDSWVCFWMAHVDAITPLSFSSG